MTYFAEKVLPLSKTVHELISSQFQFSYELEEITLPCISHLHLTIVTKAEEEGNNERKNEQGNENTDIPREQLLDPCLCLEP